jgi:hypothetical protein
VSRMKCWCRGGGFTTTRTEFCRRILSLLSANYWDNWLSCVIDHDPEISYSLYCLFTYFILSLVAMKSHCWEHRPINSVWFRPMIVCHYPSI